MNKKEKAKTMLLAMNLISSEYNPFEGMTFEEMIMAVDPKIMDYCFALTIEIRKLLSEGYAEDEILALIEELKFNIEENISEKEAQFLKKDAKKTLKLMINNKQKENDIYE